jgi:hypothetical protein
MSSEPKQNEVEVLTSKVVQISAAPIVQEGWSPHVLLYALCEDGSVWEQSQLERKPYDLWRMVQPPAVAHVKEEPKKPHECPFEVGDVVISRFDDGATRWTVQKVLSDRIYVIAQNNETTAFIYHHEAYKYQLWKPHDDDGL